LVFTLIVLGSAAGGEAAVSAFRFAGAALSAGHHVRQVFFYGDGVAAVRRPEVPADEIDLEAGWRRLATTHGFPLIACATAAIRRGLLANDETEAVRHGVVHAGTLGQLMIALDETERLLSFYD
jgi:tRNA 2-thiouridine synthesizing protein D